MSTRGVLDNVPSPSITYGLSLGKRQSNIEDHGFIAPSISRLKLSKASSVALGSIGGETYSAITTP